MSTSPSSTADIVDFAPARTSSYAWYVAAMLALAYVVSILDRYPDANQVWWVQEEPANMGALQFIVPRLQQEFASTLRLRTASRVESASPATGSHKAHVLEQHKLMSDAFADRKGGEKH